MKLAGLGVQNIQHVDDLRRGGVQLAAHDRFGAHIRAGDNQPVGSDLVVLRHPFDQRFGDGDRRMVADPLAVELFGIFNDTGVTSCHSLRTCSPITLTFMPLSTALMTAMPAAEPMSASPATTAWTARSVLGKKSARLRCLVS